MKDQKMRQRFPGVSIPLLIAAIAVFACQSVFATVWFLSPSFPNEGGKSFAQDLLGEFGGEAAVTAAQVVDRWKIVRPDEKGYVNLLKHFTPTDDKVVYALATFEVQSPGIAWWRFGSDDSIKVWVNGEAVYSLAARRGAQKDGDECFCRVTAGINRVLLKIDNSTGDWGFYFRLAETFPQAAGTSACIASLTLPPVLLYGSQYPIEQWAFARVLNNGGEPLVGAMLRLQMNESLVAEVPVAELNPLSHFECRVRIVTRPAEAEQRIARAEAAVLLREQRIASGQSDEIALRAVHPLLTGLEDDDGILRFIHATDTHIVEEGTVLNDVRTADNLKAVVKGINAIEVQPDFVMVTGDLVLDSAPGLEYFGELMKPLRAPWLAVPGNHDKPGGEAAALRLFGKNGLPLYYSFDYAGYHLVALDGQPPSGSPVAGGLVPEEIEWLKRDLKLAEGKETIVFVHQNPLTTAIGKQENLADWPELVAVLESFLQVKWVFCGHAHVDYFAIRNGIRYIMTTATAYQFSTEEVPYFANEAGARLMEFKDGKATSRFLRVDGTWRDDPPVMESPEFLPRTEK
jgi:predicted phosphodiesterase